MYQGKFQNKTPRKKKSGKGLLIFFCVYAVLVALALFGMYCGISAMVPKLEGYGVTQPEEPPRDFFAELFAEPDWEALYTLAGESDTPCEGAAQYRAYMEEKTAGAELTCREVQSGAPNVRRFHVELGEEKVATFTISGSEPALDELILYYTRSHSVTVEKKPEHTVYINGTALDDSYTVRYTDTVAEDHLPEGVHGVRLVQQQIDGLLVPPQIEVKDENGAAVEVTLEEETGIYRLPFSTFPDMTEEEKTTVRKAAVADAQYSMRMISAAQLGQYFHRDSDIYQQIVGNDLNMQKHKSHSVDENSVEISEFCRYSDSLFSARVKLTVNVIRNAGTLKVYKLDKTYFFTPNGEGRYLVSDYTNQPLQGKREQVRLRFAVQEDAPVSMMVDTTARTVTPPSVEVPQGAQLTGWAVRTADETGAVTLTVRVLPDGTVLGDPAPMTLYPVFQ